MTALGLGLGLGLGFGLSTRGVSLVADTLPASSSANAIYFNSSSARYTMTGQTLPSGDWCIGGWFKVDKTSGRSTLIHLGASGSNGIANNNFYIVYDPAGGIVYAAGTDSAGNRLGAANNNWATANGVGLQSAYNVAIGESVFMVVQKTGNWAELWMCHNGNAPVLAARQFTTFSSITSTDLFFGMNQGSASPVVGAMRNWFKLSFSLTKDQINKVANGSNPESFGTPAGTDWRYPMDNTNSTWSDSINSITATRFLSSGYSLVTGIGYAPMTNAIFLNPFGPQGFVLQESGGSWTGTISGTYQGTGGNVEIQFLNDSNAPIQGWTTVATGVSGNTWSGTITIPKGKRWLKVQMRMVGSGGTSTMTSTLKFGVGQNIILSGQSLMEHMGASTLAYGTSDVSLNGYVSIQSNIRAYGSVGGSEYITVSGAANSGGLIEITTSWRHGLNTGAEVIISGVTGTTEANGIIRTITVTANDKFTLDGSTFTNAYVSGGYIWVVNNTCRVPNNSYETIPSAHAIIGNYISNQHGCVVQIANKAYGGQAIEQFNTYATSGGGANCYGALINLTGRRMGKLGAFLWLHGHQNVGISGYYSSGGSAGAWTGWGSLGTLYDLLKADMPNNNFLFGLAAFTSIAGISYATASATHEFRHGMKDWVTRKIANGETNCFFAGWYNDMQPQWENGVTQNAHLGASLKGYLSQASRLGHALSYRLGAVANDPTGGVISSATRSGAIIDLTVTLNGGANLRAYNNSLDPTGFEVSTSTGFGTKLTISSIQITGANTVRITLASDPSATCYVRYQYGYVGDYATSTYMTPRITGVADNGAGLIRVTTSATVSPATPSGSQKSGGHGLVTGQVVGIEGVAGATQANGVWRVTVIDSENFDLQGSSSSGLGTFVANSNLWGTSRTGVVAVELGNPIYDDRTIGGYDTNGAPLSPTYTYLTAV